MSFYADICPGLNNCTMLLALGIKGFDSLLTEDNTTTVAPSTASSMISESVNTDSNELGELNLQSTSFGATGDLRNSSILVSENMEVMSDTTIVGFVPSNVDIASTTLDPATTTIDIIDIRNNTMFDVEDGTVETMYDLEEDFMTTMKQTFLNQGSITLCNYSLAWINKVYLP